MPPKEKTATTIRKTTRPKPQSGADVESVIAWLKRTGTKATRDGMARYAIPSENAVGVPVGKLRAYAKGLGRDHALAEGLWQTGIYEARMLATFVEDPASVTPAQMDRWARDFDSWAICDTACFHLFDRTPHAWKKVNQWASRRDEFVKRAAFALLASLTVHDKKSDDAPFARSLPLIDEGASDERNFVSKSVNWALRSVGKRSAALNASCVALARKLADAKEPAPRWVGKDALRELTSASVQRRLQAKKR